MTTTWDCPEARIALGVYVLGAIDPDERVLVDAHLDTCEECRADLAEFAELPGLLAMVPAAEAIALAEGPVPGDDPLLSPMPVLARLPHPVPARAPAAEERAAPANVVDLAAARRRRRGLASVGAVAAAAVVIGAASFGGAKLASSPAPAPSQESLADPHPAGSPNGPWETVNGVNGQTAATVAYRAMRWGTQLEAKVSGLPLDTPCQMWVVKRDGTRLLAGGWTTDADEGSIWYPASAGTSASDIKSIVITVQGGQPITVTTT